jgi:2-polyprenyl-3-methyl-5-hydroxy-6-metoxy-1,4-benzoquinol methylase
MNYRDKFYKKYVSTQTSLLYGEASLDELRKQFPTWQRYFGRFLPQDKNAKILDLGCGNGGFVWWLQKIGYQNTEGVDISEEQVETARKLGIKNIRQSDIKKFLNIRTSDVPNIDVNVRTSEVPKIDGNNIRGSVLRKLKYDVIFMRDVLEHFNKEEVLDILELVYQSLKKGGVFIAQTVNAENLLWGRLRHGDFTHELAFTEESITQILTVVGFREIKIYPQRPVIHGLKSLIRFILWKYIELELKFYLLIETGSAKGIFTQNLIIFARK